jgi:hypothetical protein
MTDVARACRATGCGRSGEPTNDPFCGSCGAATDGTKVSPSIATSGAPPAMALFAADNNAARRPPGMPNIAATVVVTLLFGLFGMIPATVHTAAARQRGDAHPPYWRAFGLTFVGSIVAYTILIVSLVAAATSVKGPSTVSAQPPTQQANAGAITDNVGTVPTGRVTDPVGDVTMTDGADLTAFTWTTNGDSVHFSFSFDGVFSSDHNVTMYLKFAGSTADNNCPGLNGAGVVMDITQGQVTVSTIDADGTCADRTPVYTGTATQEADGWGVDLDPSDLRIDASSSPVTAVVLSATQTGPDTETVIQDQLPDSGTPPIQMTLS